MAIIPFPRRPEPLVPDGVLKSSGRVLRSPRNVDLISLLVANNLTPTNRQVWVQETCPQTCKNSLRALGN